MLEFEGTVDTSATVLIIDDSPENRYVVRRALTRAGMQVIEAGTGAEGSQLALQDPDLIILDVNLPDTTGFELCHQFKTDPVTAHVPVIHLSQSAVDDHSQVRGLEGGADAYLTDPIRASVLVATIKALLRMRRAEDELRRQAEDAHRIAVLNSRVAAASTEAGVVTALLDSLTDPYVVRRAYLFPQRPWVLAPSQVYPVGAEPSDEPLPVTQDRIGPMVDQILTERGTGMVYDESGRCAWMVLPLIAYSREMGTLLVEFAAGIVLPERNQIRLGIAAERCAEAMERARLFEDHRAIASALQTSLLPATLPEVPDVEIAAQYRAGAEGMVVGGDFYDVFHSREGWSAIIGDVCGRGALAASRTSLARHTAREAARHDDDPATVLGALENAMAADKRQDQLDLVSAICVRLCPRGPGVDVSYAVAGHPAPVLIRADGQASTIGPHGPILGIDRDPTFVTAELHLAAGDVLFLYTDGVTEARRGGVLYGEERMISELRELVLSGSSVRELANAPIMAAAAYNEVHDDDMATLVLRARA